MVYLCSYLSDEAFIQEAFHMPKPVAKQFWDAFVPEYFGPQMSLKEAEDLILPFAGLKTLIIERDTRRPMPEFRPALDSILK